MTEAHSETHAEADEAGRSLAAPESFLDQVRRNWKWLTSVLLVLLLCFALLQTDPASIRNVLSQIGKLSFIALLPPLIFVLSQVAAQISRMWVLFPGSFQVSWHHVGRAVSYGQFINMFIPARAGDFVKIVAMTDKTGRLGGVQASDATGVLVADKVTDILSLLLLVAIIGLPVNEYFAGKSFSVGTWVVWPLLGLAALLWVMRLILPTAFHRMIRWLRRTLGALLTLAHPTRLITSILFGFACWGGEAMAISLLCQAFGINLTAEQALWTLVALNLGIAIPVSVANVGTFEAAMAFALSRFGVSGIQAISIATVHHALQVFSVAIWAATFWLGGRIMAGKEEMAGFKVKEEDKEKALEYFNRRSQAYDQVVKKGFLKSLRKRERDAVLKLASLASPARSMIDVGCGGGFYALEAKAAGMRVTATDAVPAMLDALRDRVDEVAASDIESLDTSKVYDRVVCAGVLDFVKHPEKAFRGLCQITAPDGRLVILVPRSGLFGWVYRTEKKLSGFRVNLFTVKWFQRLAESEGLTLGEVIYPIPTNMVISFERPKAGLS